MGVFLLKKKIIDFHFFFLLKKSCIDVDMYFTFTCKVHVNRPVLILPVHVL